MVWFYMVKFPLVMLQSSTVISFIVHVLFKYCLNTSIVYVVFIDVFMWCCSLVKPRFEAIGSCLSLYVQTL